MRKIFRFPFQRETYWLVAICVVVPLVAIVRFIVITGLWPVGLRDIEAPTLLECAFATAISRQLRRKSCAEGRNE